MNNAIAHNNAQHAENLSCLANALPAVRDGRRIDAIDILLTFRHHEQQRRRARRSYGIDAPSPHTARQQALLSALRTMILSRMQQPAQEGAR